MSSVVRRQQNHGDQNTDAHSAPGIVGTALEFDGVDDRIVLTADSHRYALEANRDFSITFWRKTNSPDPAPTLYLLSNRIDTESSFFAYTSAGNLTLACRFVTGEIRWAKQYWAGGADDEWRHYVLTLKGMVLSFYRDGELAQTHDHPENTLSLTPGDVDLTIGTKPSGDNPSPGLADDFRIYDRALTAEEIEALAAGP